MGTRTSTRRAFLETAGIFSALGLLRLVPGCSLADDPLEQTLPTRGSGREDNVTGPPPPTDGDEFVPEKPNTENAPPEQPQADNAEWAAKAKELESKNVGGVAYTNEAPGPFAGKERSHVPQVTIQSDGVAIVLVSHVMDAGSPATDAGAPEGGLLPGLLDAGYVDSGGPRPPHYVSTIWVTDDQGRVIFMKQFLPTDAAPPFIALAIPEGTKTIRAYEHCNLHGVWASAPI